MRTPSEAAAHAKDVLHRMYPPRLDSHLALNALAFTLAWRNIEVAEIVERALRDQEQNHSDPTYATASGRAADAMHKAILRARAADMDRTGTEG